MYLSKLLLCSLGITLSAAAPSPQLQKRGSFPIPYIGESVEDYAQQLLSFLAGAILGPVDNLRAIATIAPKPSLSFNADFLKAVSKTDDLPNYNTPFDPVDGVDESKVKWLIQTENRERDDPVILLLHGGGYVFGMFPMYPALWQDVWKQFNIKSDRLSIVWLDYGIAPDQVYPVPLQQASAVYNTLAKTSDNIIVAGDSAGGHLALNLLRHIKYPVESVAQVSAKPQGLITLSPWVNVYPIYNNGTYVTNGDVDIMSGPALSSMGEISITNNETRTSAALNMWKDYIDWSEVLPDYSKVFVSYGDQEVLKGDIEKWLEISNLANSKATIFRQLGGHHDDSVFTLKNSTIFPPLVDFVTSAFA